ncbi:MAG: hypothetical protein AAGK47_03520, partial [Bacteroidota bacterium]
LTALKCRTDALHRLRFCLLTHQNNGATIVQFTIGLLLIFKMLVGGVVHKEGVNDRGACFVVFGFRYRQRLLR